MPEIGVMQFIAKKLKIFVLFNHIMVRDKLM